MLSLVSHQAAKEEAATRAAMATATGDIAVASSQRTMATGEAAT
jgi:hypothetical protein